MGSGGFQPRSLLSSSIGPKWSRVRCESGLCVRFTAHESFLVKCVRFEHPMFAYHDMCVCCCVWRSLVQRVTIILFAAMAPVYPAAIGQVSVLRYKTSSPGSFDRRSTNLL